MAERKVVQEVVDDLNATLGGQLGVVLQLGRWEIDARPGFHVEGPQGLVDSVLDIEDCDVFLGIFWRRFGTPVADAGSGTEHEFQKAYRSWQSNGKPEIWFYFSERQYSPKQQQELFQWARVLKFKEEFPNEGFWWSYRSTPQFRELVRRHLTQLLHRSQFRGQSQSQRVITRAGVSIQDAQFDQWQIALNSKFSFASFVVGASNQFPLAAAREIARSSPRSYDPLFLWGKAGTGKTHLLHAIARCLLDSQPSARVILTSSDRFTNQMIASIRAQQVARFQEYYRDADVLLLDDIQFIANKERTQEELFHTFDELYDRQKRIVLACEFSPKRICGLSDRLRSRFESGLVAELSAPDLETMIAILDKKAEEQGVIIPDDVRTFLATNINFNIRDLQTALTMLAAYSKLIDCPITLAIAQPVLRSVIGPADPRGESTGRWTESDPAG